MFDSLSSARQDVFTRLAVYSADGVRFRLDVRNQFTVRVGFGHDPETFDDFVEWLMLLNIPHEHLDPEVVGFLGVDVVVEYA